MKYHTHQSTSLLIGLGLKGYIGISEPLIYYLSIFVSSILPDIDHRNSKINKYNPFKFLIPKSGHRKLTHSILGTCIYSGILTIIFNNPNLIKGLILGYSSHLLGDYFTRQGIPLLYPNKKHFKSPLTFTTGSTTEYIIFIISLILLTIYGIKDIK